MRVIFSICLAFAFCISILHAQPKVKRYKLKDTTLAQQLVEEGKAMGKAQKNELAVEKLKEAQHILQQIYGENSFQAGEIWFEMANLAYSNYNYDQAINHLNNLLKTRIKHYGEKHQAIAIVYQNLGTLYTDSDKHTEAALYLEKALNLQKELLGEDHLDVALTYRSMGSVYENTGDYEKAIAYRKKALALRLKKLDENHYDVASSYLDLGNSYDQLAIFDTAMIYKKKALNVLVALFGEKHEDVARVYGNIGVTYARQGLIAEAVPYFEKDTKISEQIYGDQHPELINNFQNLGLAYSDLGEYDKSIAYNFKALAIIKGHFKEENKEFSDAYNNIGLAYYYKEDFDKALEYFEQALAIRIKILGETHPELANIYDNFGMTYDEEGLYEEAITFYNKGLNIRLSALDENHPKVATSYNNLGSTYFRMGQFENAIFYHEKALAIRLQVFGNRNIGLAFSYGNLSASYTAIGKYENALEYGRRTLKLLRNTFGDVHPQTSNAYHNLGLTHLFMNQPDSADIYFSKGLAIRKQIFGAKHSSIASSYLSKWVFTGSPASKEETPLLIDSSFAALNYSDTTKLDRVNSIPLLISTFLGEIAFLKNRYKKTKQIADLYKAYDASLESFKVVDYQFNLLSTDSRVNLARSNRTLYENALQNNALLYKLTDSLKYFNGSFDLAEKSKSLILYQSIQEANALDFAGIPDSLLAQEQQIRQAITNEDKRKQDKLNQGYADTDTSVLQIIANLFDLNQTYEALKRQLERNYPNYYKLKYDLSTVSVEECQSTLLQKDQGLLEYFVGDTTIFIFLIKKDDLKMVEVERDFPLNEWVLKLQKNSSKPYPYTLKNYTQTAYDLYQKLVAPLADQLPERLIIIPDGILGYLPFETLLSKPAESLYKPESYAYLLKKHQISYSYSATLLKEMQARKAKKAPAREVLAMAPYSNTDTILTSYLDKSNAIASLRGDTLSPLPKSGVELDSLVQLFNTDAFYGEQATEERFIEQASNYRILHLATHGKADERVGDYSYLAFAPQPDSIENELLYVRDLYNLELAADLVVLSACETGRGEFQFGEGIVSLARAFAYAGAKSIVTTLWQIDDQSTQTLMVSFYSYLKKGWTKDKALHQAKLDYIQSKKGLKAHPALWAGVIGIGDVRELR